MKNHLITFCLLAAAALGHPISAPAAELPPAASVRLHAGDAREPADAFTFGEGVYIAVGKCGTVLRSANGRDWRKRKLPTRCNLHGVAYGEGQFVAAGSHGAIFTSTKGLHWKQRESGTTSCLKAVAFGAGRFVAVGTEGALLGSVDGAKWERQSSGVSGIIRDVIFADGRFIAAGDHGILLHSKDGTSWAPSEVDPIYFKSLTHQLGQFIASGSRETLASSDGIQWELLE